MEFTYSLEMSPAFVLQSAKIIMLCKLETKKAGCDARVGYKARNFDELSFAHINHGVSPQVFFI